MSKNSGTTRSKLPLKISLTTELINYFKNPLKEAVALPSYQAKDIRKSEVAIIFNEVMEENHIFNSKVLRKEEVEIEKWGNSLIINKILNSNPNLKQISVDWSWIQHNYIKLLSIVLDIEKSCNLSTNNLTNDEIKDIINCIKKDSKFALQINLDGLSPEDKKDFVYEIQKVYQMIKHFSEQHHPDMEEICNEAYQNTDDKQNFRCNVEEGKYVDINHQGHRRKLLSLDEDLAPLQNPEDWHNIPKDNLLPSSDGIGSFSSSNTSLSLTALGILFFPLPVLITFCICAGYRYYASSGQDNSELSEALLGEEGNHHEHNE